MKQTEKINLLVEALAKFNLEFQSAGLKKDAMNPSLRNKYVTLDNILNTVRPLLANNGLAIVQALDGESLITTLYHISGQYIQSEMPFSPMSGNKGTNALQELGGGITYARRYSLSAILGISVDADEDGNNSNIKKEQLKKPAPRKKVSSQEELNKLLEWLVANPSRVQDYTKYYELTQEQIKFINDNL